MARCIYVPDKELNDRHPSDDFTKSLEHIVPWAIGGSNGFSTQDVSTKANNDLGTQIDAPLARLLPVAILRHQLKLTGQSGKIPPIELDAIATKNGADTRIALHADGRVEFVPDLQVKKAPLTNGAEIVDISGGRADVERVLQNMREKAERTGKKFHTSGGELLSSSLDFEQQYESVELDEFKIPDIHLLFPEFNQKVWARGIMKMVLGLGHKALGPEWTFGEWGNRVRRFLSDDEDQWPKEQMKGRLTGRLPKEVSKILGITSASLERYEHVLAVLPADNNKQLMAVVSLFGGKGVPQAVVGIGPPVGCFRVAGNDTLPAQLPVGWRIRPSTRVADAITIAEMVARNGG